MVDRIIIHMTINIVKLIINKVLNGMELLAIATTIEIKNWTAKKEEEIMIVGYL